MSATRRFPLKVKEVERRMSVEEVRQERFYEHFEVGDIHRDSLWRTVTAYRWLASPVQNAAPLCFSHRALWTEFGKPVANPVLSSEESENLVVARRECPALF